MDSSVVVAGFLAAFFGVAGAGCGDRGDGAGAAGGAGAAAGGGGAEPCVDIHVDARLLPDPAAWGSGPLNPNRKAYWRTDRGLHVAWLNAQADGLPFWLVVSTFDPETGTHLGSNIYDPFPSDNGYAVLADAAGAPDGSFALVVNYPDQSEVLEVADRLALGHLDAPGTLLLWDPPYNGAEAAPLHVDWDGDSFTMHAVPVPLGGLPMRLSRVRPDGTAIESDVAVGAPVAADPMYAAIRTDPDSGRTWTVSTANAGVWLGGHDRQGTLLPGTEAEGMVLVQAQGAIPQGSSSVGLAVAADGGQAMVGWYYASLLENRFQRVAESAPEGDALVLPDAPFDDYQGDAILKTLERHGTGWWTGLVRPLAGIASVDLTDGGVASDRVLVRHDACSFMDGTCAPGEDEGFRASHLQSLRHQDELWLGFLDNSGAYLDGSTPYRIVRVADHCEYGSEALVLQGR